MTSYRAVTPSQTPRLSPSQTPRLGPVAFTPRELLTPRSKPDHEIPVLDVPWVSDIEKSHESDDAREVTFLSHEKEAIGGAVAAELSSLLPMLIANFSKIHSSNAMILSKLQLGDYSRHVHAGGPTATVSHATMQEIVQQKSKQAAYQIPELQPQLPIVYRSTSSQSVAQEGGVVHHTSSDLTRLHQRLGLSVQKCISNHSSSVPSLFGGASGNSQNLEFLKGARASSSKSAGVQGSLSFRSRLRNSLRQSISSLISKGADMEAVAKIIGGHSSRLHQRAGWARNIWVFLESRTSSRAAYVYGSYFAPMVIFCSVLISFMQTVDEWALPDVIFLVVQMTFEFWFACEIAIRFAVCPDKVQFWFFAFNWIDVVSALPLFLRIIVWAADLEGEFLLSAIALIPMLRLLKMLRRFYKFQLLVSACAIALEALPVLLFCLMLIALMFSGLMYLVEDRDLLPDLPEALWFVMVTMSTVGYGDIAPDTRIGKLLTATLMVLSSLYMALPIGIVGNAFSEVWKDRDRLLLLAVLRESFAISGVSRQLVMDVFHHFTDDSILYENEGEIEMDATQFQNMIAAFQIDVSAERCAALFGALDEDNSGKISCDEFIHKLFPDHFMKLLRMTEASQPQSPNWHEGNCGWKRSSTEYGSTQTNQTPAVL